MKMLSWNVRGLVKPSTQNEVLNLLKKFDVSIFGVMETRLKVRSLEKMMRNRFNGWRFVSNLSFDPGGRIAVVELQ